MAKDWGLKKKTMEAELDLPKLQEVRTWRTRQVERVKVKEVEMPALKEKVEKVKVKEMVERLREVEKLPQKGKVERVKVNESFIVKKEVMQTLMKSDVGLVEEMVQWLAADPKVQFVFISSSNHRQSHRGQCYQPDQQVCSLWPQLAQQLGLAGQVPILAGEKLF